MIVRNVPLISFIAAPRVLGSKAATTIVTRGDTGKGVDVTIGASAVSEEESDAQVDEQLQQLAVVETRKLAPVSISVELERAARICFQSKQAVISMFQEARMGKSVDVDGAQQLVEDISDSVARNPGALISLARLKTADDYTYMHSVAVCAMMVGLAKQLGLDEVQTRAAGMAGLLHDLGKALMPIEVLNKPGKLSPAEFNIIKTHPSEGHRLLLTGLNVDPLVLDVCLNHHEKTDGSGYPKGLKGDQISLFAKMGAVCDVYDAIMTFPPKTVVLKPCSKYAQGVRKCQTNRFVESTRRNTNWRLFGK